LKNNQGLLDLAYLALSSLLPLLLPPFLAQFLKTKKIKRNLFGLGIWPEKCSATSKTSHTSDSGQPEQLLILEARSRGY
jgi:hypothetical protein